MNTEIELPQTLESRYHFLIGVIQGMIDFEEISKHAVGLNAIKLALSSNASGESEASIIEQINQYQAKPPVYPFGDTAPALTIAHAAIDPEDFQEDPPAMPVTVDLTGEDVEFLEAVLNEYSSLNAEVLDNSEWAQINRIEELIRPSNTAA